MPSTKKPEDPATTRIDPANEQRESVSDSESPPIDGARLLADLENFVSTNPPHPPKPLPEHVPLVLSLHLLEAYAFLLLALSPFIHRPNFGDLRRRIEQWIMQEERTLGAMSHEDRADTQDPILAIAEIAGGRRWLDRAQEALALEESQQ